MQKTYLEFLGESWSFARLLLKNAVLSILTLGFYFPWARTSRRRYLWSNTSLLNHRLEYLGTPQEILKGYMKMLGLVGLLVLGEILLKPLLPDFYPLFRMAYTLTMLLFIPWAVYRSRQYLMGRTRWRGIRFAMNPSSSQYIFTYIKSWILTSVTLGLYTPWRYHHLHRALIENAYIGNSQLKYVGEANELSKIFYKGLIFTLLSFGLYYFWLKANLVTYLIQNTEFQGKKLDSTLEGGHLFTVFVLQFLLVPLTLGIAIPWVSLYKLRVLLSNIGLSGAPDFGSLGQTPFKSVNALGEQAADFVDSGDFGL